MIGSRWVVGMDTVAWKRMALAMKLCFDGDVDEYVK
jgi:hypothetical protein